MNRSIYSLVLMDSLVLEIDRLAAEMSTSRSNMTNQILAEYLSLVTPERRIQNIFVRAESVFSKSSDLFVAVNPSERAMSIKSVLNFKYKPTVRYSVVLYNVRSDAFGELRVAFRTQNHELLDILTAFFIQWTNVEKKFRKSSVNNTDISPGKLIRVLTLPANCELSDEALGEATARYVSFFDKTMKAFFIKPHDFTSEYARYLAREPFPI